MKLGIGISNIGLCISWENTSKIYGAMQYGLDLAKPSQMSAADTENLKTILDSYTGLFLSEFNDMSRLSELGNMCIVVSCPVGMELLEYAALKSLFQRMGIRVRRFINSGMARGLFVSQQEPELQGKVCCVGCNKGSVELTVLEIDDGVVEALGHEVYQDEAEWDFVVMDQHIAELTAQYGDLEAVFLHYSKPPKQGQESVKFSCAPRTVRLDDIAAGGGAVIMTEVLCGEKTVLPLNLCPFGLLCAVGGNEVALLACDDTVPVKRTMEIEVGANRSVELELFAVSNGTAIRSSIHKTTFPPLSEKRTVGIKVAVGADLDTEILIETNGERYKLHC